MKKSLYPILRYPIAEDLVIALDVFSNQQWIDRDWDELQKRIESDLNTRDMSREDQSVPRPLSKVRLKILKLSLRPVSFLRDETRIDPQTLPLRIPLVYAREAEDRWLGYSPWYVEGCFRSVELKALEKGLLDQVESEIQGWSLSRLTKLIRLQDPSLEFFEIKKGAVGKIKRSPARASDSQGSLSFLSAWGEAEPRPTTAWEPAQAWQREEEVAELLGLLDKPYGGIMVLGESGSGRSLTIRQALSQWIDQRKGEPAGCWRVHSRRLPSGVRYLGEWQGLVEELVRNLNATRSILWLDDPAGALQSGGHSPDSSVAGYLQLFLEERKLLLIAEASPGEWEQIQEKLPGLAQQMNVVSIRDLRPNQVRMILEAYAQQQFRTSQIRIGRSALEEAYRLTNRFLPQEPFPGKGIRLLTFCFQKAQSSRRKRVDRSHIIEEFSRQTGLPELFLRDDLSLDNRDLQAFFEERILGQPEAVQQLTEVVKVFKAGLNNPQKPITSLLFAGPTGVGKTASVEALAEYFFEDRASEKLIRLDMSELQFPEQVDRLIGNLYQEGGNHLAGQVREQPFSIVLLDEIEKADSLVFDTLLNILDEGLLVDSFGRLTHFRNSIIIMTTNLGADAPVPIGFSESDPSDRYRKALEGYFRPEFINRIDGSVFFRKLRPEHLDQIARRELKRLQERSGLRSRNLSLHFSDALVAYLAREGWDEKFGARPLQRLIERKVATALAEWLLARPEIEDTPLNIGLDTTQMVTFAT